MKKCPYAFKLAYIDKLRGPSVPAMERGTHLHSLAEHYLLGDITGGVPKQLRKIETEFKALKAEKPTVEKFWGLTADWEPAKEKGWVVARTDAFIPPNKKRNVLDIIDHKSGRIYPEHDKQGSLYSAIGFGLYPNVDEIDVSFFYIDQGVSTSYKYTRAKLKHGMNYWLAEGEKLMSTTKFLPTPSKDACGWCGFRSDKKLANGERGPCKAWRIVK
jgi:hypothetical protein